LIADAFGRYWQQAIHTSFRLALASISYSRSLRFRHHALGLARAIRVEPRISISTLGTLRCRLPARTPHQKLPTTVLAAWSGVGTIRERRVPSRSSARGQIVRQWDGMGWGGMETICTNERFCDWDDSRRGEARHTVRVTVQEDYTNCAVHLPLSFPLENDTYIPSLLLACMPPVSSRLRVLSTNHYFAFSIYVSSRTTQCSALSSRTYVSHFIPSLHARTSDA
jgi:hypothetical protein